jgi:RES domain-containing protein
MTIYRLHRGARGAADFAGAMLAGGRWNSIGTPMLYTAEHLSLACLEVLVHVDKTQIPRDYVWSKADLDAVVEGIRIPALTDITACQEFGGSWIHRANQLALRVPSAVIPEEFNVLLNPTCAGYQNVVWSDPRPFGFDRRLFAAGPQTL